MGTESPGKGVDGCQNASEGGGREARLMSGSLEMCVAGKRSFFLIHVEVYRLIEKHLLLIAPPNSSPSSRFTLH